MRNNISLIATHISRKFVSEIKNYKSWDSVAFLCMFFFRNRLPKKVSLPSVFFTKGDSYPNFIDCSRNWATLNRRDSCRMRSIVEKRNITFDFSMTRSRVFHYFNITITFAIKNTALIREKKLA